MAKQWTQNPFPKVGWPSPFPVIRGQSPATFKCPLPRNDADFAILSEVVFGVPLTLKTLFLMFDKRERTDWGHTFTVYGSGDAEIAEPYDSFATKDGYFTSYGTHGYNRLSWFWQTVMGPMDCSRSLTHTSIRILSHRQARRLEAWNKDRRNGGASTPSKAFVRLAHTYGVGENIVDRNRPPESGVLMSGRVDAALTASLSGAA